MSAVTVTKELDSKNKDSNIAHNLWLLLFPILVSQGRYIQIEGRRR